MDIPDSLLSLNDAIAWELMTLPGVTGVGVGFRIVDGVAVEEPALRVSVADLSQVPEGIPNFVGEFGVSVYEADFTLCGLPPDNLRYQEIAGGIKIGSAVADVGTLGAVVSDTSGEGLFDVLALTCAHCVVPLDAVGAELVWQPDTPALIFPVPLQDLIGNVAGFSFPREPDPATGFRTSTVDAAVLGLGPAVLAGRSISRRIVGNGGGSDTIIAKVSNTRRAVVGDPVVKRGCMTRVRVGRVHEVRRRLPWRFQGVNNAFLVDQFVIASDLNPDNAFAVEGDSGSIVLIDGEETAIGMVCYKFPGFVVANEITNVEAALRISLAQ